MSTEQQTQKYFYKYRLEAKADPDATRDETSQAELQAYINEVLGIKRPKRAESTNLTH